MLISPFAVVVGGGKSGWNKLLGKPAIAAKEKARQLAELKEGTNLKKAEQQNEERRWAEEAEKVKVAKEAPKPKEEIATVPATGLVDVKGKGRAVGEVDPTVNGKPLPPQVVEGEEEEEEEDELGATHGMFAGAGKFLLAGGLAGAGNFAVARCTSRAERANLPLVQSREPLPLPSTVSRSTSSPHRQHILLQTLRHVPAAPGRGSSSLAATQAAFPPPSALF